MGQLATALAGFLAKLFGKNLDFFADVITKRVALTAAVIGIIIGMMATLYAGVTAILNGIVYIMPDFIVTAASWIVPDNLNECVFAYLAAETAIAVYKWQKEQIKLSMYIT